MMADRLGVRAEAAEWCTIDKIPQPPAEVLRAMRPSPAAAGETSPSGHGRRGARTAFRAARHAVVPSGRRGGSAEAGPRDEVREERLRAKDAADRRRDALIAERGLDQVFDGNWHGDAGRFLLGWYSRSAHPERLVVAVEDGIVLAAPPKRVSVGKEKHMRVVARLSGSEAVLVDPFNGEFDTRIVLVRFRDRSWLRLGTVEPRGALHKYLLRQPLADS